MREPPPKFQPSVTQASACVVLPLWLQGAQIKDLMLTPTKPRRLQPVRLKINLAPRDATCAPAQLLPAETSSGHLPAARRLNPLAFPRPRLRSRSCTTARHVPDRIRSAGPDDRDENDTIPADRVHARTRRARRRGNL